MKPTRLQLLLLAALLLPPVSSVMAASREDFPLSSADEQAAHLTRAEIRRCASQWRRINEECVSAKDESSARAKMRCVHELRIRLPCALRRRLLEQHQDGCPGGLWRAWQEWTAFQASSRDVCFERCYYAKMDMLSAEGVLDAGKTVGVVSSFLQSKGWPRLQAAEEADMRACLQELTERRNGSCQDIWRGVLCTANATSARLQNCIHGSCRALLLQQEEEEDSSSSSDESAERSERAAGSPRETPFFLV